MSKQIYHTFRGFMRGWSDVHCNPIDITKIISMKNTRRLFCIKDVEYPFTLTIEYHDPKEEIVFAPMLVPMFVPILIPIIYNDNTSIMTLRYKTSQEVYNEINTIKNMQNDIKNLLK